MLLQFVAICLCVNKLHSASFQLESVVEDPSWVRDLRGRIDTLVSRHGYEGAKPFIKRLIEDTEKKQSALLDVRGNSRVNYVYSPRYVLRTRPIRAADNDTLAEVEPEWLTNLRAYVKHLVTLYGRKHLDSHLRPVITSLQEENSVKVTDIDVDSFGNVMVKYVDEKKQIQKHATKSRPAITRKEKRKRSRKERRRATEMYE